MALSEAECYIRVQLPSLVNEQSLSALHKEPACPLYDDDDKGKSALGQDLLVSLTSDLDVPPKTRLQWADNIAEMFLNRKTEQSSSAVRDWALVLDLDGSVVNRADATTIPSPSDRTYPVRCQISDKILGQLGSVEEKVQRAELFALGSLLYQVFAGKEIFLDEEDGVVQQKFENGDFPDDVWGLSKATRILACWCPRFAKVLLADHQIDKPGTLGSKVAGYIKKHPVRVGLWVVGGVTSLASVAALPVIGAVGFGALGPAAASTAAAWQSSVGVVQAGSLFAWCQSAAMGGAAVGGIITTGLTGAVVVGVATVSSVLDSIEITAPDLRDKFLTAWKQDIGEQ